jgi:hypothetical protein
MQIEHGIKAHPFKNVFTSLKDWVHFMIPPHASRVMVFWSEPGSRPREAVEERALEISVDFALEMHKMMGFYLPQIRVWRPGSLGQSGDRLRKGPYGQSRIRQTVGTLLNK